MFQLPLSPYGRFLERELVKAAVHCTDTDTNLNCFFGLHDRKQSPLPSLPLPAGPPLLDSWVRETQILNEEVKRVGGETQVGMSRLVVNPGDLKELQFEMPLQTVLVLPMVSPGEPVLSVCKHTNESVHSERLASLCI